MKKTPWFPGHVKPARVGVYERKWPDGERVWSVWNGRHWGHSFILTERRVDECRFLGIGMAQDIPWRGLTTKDGQ